MTHLNLHAENILSQVKHRTDSAIYRSQSDLDTAYKNSELLTSLINRTLFNASNFKGGSLSYEELTGFINAHFSDVVELLVWAYPESVKKAEMLEAWYSLAVQYSNNPASLQDAVKDITQDRVCAILNQDAESLRTLLISTNVLEIFDTLVNSNH